jgi:uncharacterized protein (DUF2236 family)
VPVSGVSATLGYLSSLFPPPPAAYEAFVGPLTRRRRDRYHREMSRFAAVFGVPADLLPGSYAELQD